MRIWIKDEIWKRCEEALDNRCSLLSHSDVQNDKSVSLDSVQYSTVVYAGLVTDWKHMEKRETIELSMQILELIALKMKVFWSTEHEKRREIIWYQSGIRYPLNERSCFHGKILSVKKFHVRCFMCLPRTLSSLFTSSLLHTTQLLYSLLQLSDGNRMTLRSRSRSDLLQN
jgi:flagellar biosynthesis regulator FlaF